MNELIQIDEYRKLLKTEINQLQNQGCTASDWDQILVGDVFIPDTKCKFLRKNQDW